MFGFIKKAFFTGLPISSSVNQMSETPLICIAMPNQICKVDQKLLILKAMSLCFILLVLKQVNVVVIVAVSIIPMQNVCS